MIMLDKIEQLSFRTAYLIMGNLEISSRIPRMLLAY